MGLSLRNSDKMAPVSVKDVDQQKFVVALSAFLKKSGKVRVPEWADIVKTSVAKELAHLRQGTSRCQDHHKDLWSATKQRFHPQPLDPWFRLSRPQGPPDSGTAQAGSKGPQRWTCVDPSGPTGSRSHRFPDQAVTGRGCCTCCRQEVKSHSSHSL